MAFELTLSSSSSTAVTYAVQMPESPTASVFDLIGRVEFGDILNGGRHLAPDVFHLPEGATGVITAILDDPFNEAATLTSWPVDGPLDGPLTFASPTLALTPASGSVITRTTEFRTSDPEGTLTSHAFNISGGTSAHRFFFIHTFEDHVSFPVLESLLEDVVPSDLAEWFVFSMPQVTTPEQATEELVGYIAWSLNARTSNVGVARSAPVQVSATYARTFSAPVGGSSMPSAHDRLEALLPR